jgi:hypothetical protein
VGCERLRFGWSGWSRCPRRCDCDGWTWTATGPPLDCCFAAAPCPLHVDCSSWRPCGPTPSLPHVWLPHTLPPPSLLHQHLGPQHCLIAVLSGGFIIQVFNTVRQRPSRRKAQPLPAARPAPPSHAHSFPAHVVQDRSCTRARQGGGDHPNACTPTSFRGRRLAPRAGATYGGWPWSMLRHHGSEHRRPARPDPP